MIHSHTSENGPDDPDEPVGDGVADVDDGEALAAVLDGGAGALDVGAAVVGAAVGDGLPAAWLPVAAGTAANLGRAPPASLARADPAITPASTPAAIPAVATSTAASSIIRRMSVIVIGPLSLRKALPARPPRQAPPRKSGPPRSARTSRSSVA
jgi:hypothetical protein